MGSSMQPLPSSETDTRKARLSARASELLSDRDGLLPVWIRSPKSGPEHYTGFSRSKLYELAAKGKISSRSIREPGQIRGTRLFNLRSILDFIESCGDENGTASVRRESIKESH
jgi:hypothetical protein